MRTPLDTIVEARAKAAPNMGNVGKVPVSVLTGQPFPNTIIARDGYPRRVNVAKKGKRHA